MIEIQAPHKYDHLTGKTRVFLAGSIEMGAAEQWQRQIVDALADQSVLLLNPRREDWDSSWEQSIENPWFREQVEWELQAMDDADIIAMYFDPSTRAPITLLELGIHASRNPHKLVICCPEGYWRKGNVDIICARYDIQQSATLAGMLALLRERFA